MEFKKDYKIEPCARSRSYPGGRADGYRKTIDFTDLVLMDEEYRDNTLKKSSAR
ncbi:hypothetical protein GDO81_024913 [Engystomops pustulosus]|uniref:Uncharacterized protein n=1 Tax=Engystomops pustulosus TaxID=76066 RepID=A0AAV6YT25_ENGPU|nr:hypothetical protein GDO81_024913 [Engystomops pustulosus]